MAGWLSRGPGGAVVADDAASGATAGVLGVGVIRRPTSFPASQDGSLKDSGAVLVVTVAAEAARSGRRPRRRVRNGPPQEASLVSPPVTPSG